MVFTLSGGFLPKTGNLAPEITVLQMGIIMIDAPVRAQEIKNQDNVASTPHRLATEPGLILAEPASMRQRCSRAHRR